MKEPVDHIIRPRLPWRPESAAITECGYDASKVKSVMRDEFFKRLKEYGEQRSALLTCMTCMSTAKRWPTWQDDPRLAISREVEWEGAHWSSFMRETSERRGHLLRDELFAVESLIAAHPDEFRDLLASIDARRQWLDRKAKNERSQ